MYASYISPKFIHHLEHARDEHKTGKLYAYARSDSPDLQIGLLYFLAGKLCGSVLGSITGRDAIQNILSSKIATAMFVNLDKKEVIEQPAMPDVDEVFSFLNSSQSSIQSNEESTIIFTHREIVQAVNGTLSDIIGSNITGKIEKLSELYSPSSDLNRFADECIRLTTNYIGKKRATEILGPLFMQ